MQPFSQVLRSQSASGSSTIVFSQRETMLSWLSILQFQEEEKPRSHLPVHKYPQAGKLLSLHDVSSEMLWSQPPVELVTPLWLTEKPFVCEHSAAPLQVEHFITDLEQERQSLPCPLAAKAGGQAAPEKPWLHELGAVQLKLQGARADGSK
eukprot:CAMPEP_0119347214 /NCGR_PEP_ID=MMETSP1333-20130426/108406_1 /TAXON_ID=418940 /ORGANISM="Scyphosphaera apsteinii, Strain RCC1455" /LENGTH=150 /DNA_ID=CAMNT_0007359747 /DNA_START=904 /DNA_END=1356 /DNA_ORIENTATION=+